MRRRNPLPDEPAYFTDRSLGRRIVPDALRAAGMTVETLAERYPDNESIADEQWIREVTDDGLVILLKDARVRKKPAERLAILESGARAFVITNAQLTGDAMSELILENRGRMEQALRRPGPFIYALYRGRIEQLELERRDV